MKAIAEDIKTGKFKNVYLLYGEEGYLVRQYEKRLKNALSVPGDTMNCSELEGKGIDPETIIDLSETLPFLARRRCVFVRGSGFFKKSPDALVSYMEKIPPTSFLVFSDEEVDARCKLYRRVKKLGRAAEFKRQNERNLARWVAEKMGDEGRKASRPVIEMFLSETGNDMERIETELEKLFCYTLGRDVVERSDVEAVCAGQAGDRIFEMVDAIAGKRQKKALDLYYDLLMRRESPHHILFLITRQFRILMQVGEMRKCGIDSSRMAKKAGVPGFALRKYAAQAKRFDGQQLAGAVREGIRAEEDIKSGKMDTRLAVELLIMSLSDAAY